MTLELVLAGSQLTIKLQLITIKVQSRWNYEAVFKNICLISAAVIPFVSGIKKK